MLYVWRIWVEMWCMILLVGLLSEQCALSNTVTTDNNIHLFCYWNANNSCGNHMVHERLEIKRNYCILLFEQIMFAPGQCPKCTCTFTLHLFVCQEERRITSIKNCFFILIRSEFFCRRPWTHAIQFILWLRVDHNINLNNLVKKYKLLLFVSTVLVISLRCTRNFF